MGSEWSIEWIAKLEDFSARRSDNQIKAVLGISSARHHAHILAVCVVNIRGVVDIKWITVSVTAPWLDRYLYAAGIGIHGDCTCRQKCNYRFFHTFLIGFAEFPFPQQWVDGSNTFLQDGVVFLTPEW